MTNGSSWKWDEKVQKAFLNLKKISIVASVLGHPDPSKAYIPEKDASNVRVRAVLFQLQDAQS